MQKNKGGQGLGVEGHWRIYEKSVYTHQRQVGGSTPEKSIQRALRYMTLKKPSYQLSTQFGKFKIFHILGIIPAKGEYNKTRTTPF